jgi:cytochrome c-type biogenesis protein CcmH
MSAAVLFSVVAVVLVVVALAFVLPTLLRSRPKEGRATRAAINADIYRQEVDELHEEAARGEIDPADVLPAHEELRRRLLQHSSTEGMPRAAPSWWRWAGLVVAVALPLLAAALYFTFGMPDALTTTETVEEGKSDGDYIARLKSQLARQPRDGRGWVLLARAQADRTEYKAAAASFQKALTVSEKIAKDPGVLCEYADALGMAQGGRLDGKPAELIAQALAIDPNHPVALEMAGSAAYSDGRYADALRYWNQLLADLPAGDDRIGDLKAAIARAERKAAAALPRS